MNTQNEKQMQNPIPARSAGFSMRDFRFQKFYHIKIQIQNLKFFVSLFHHIRKKYENNKFLKFTYVYDIHFNLKAQ